MDFEKICMMFTMQEPYYGILLSAMERVPAPHLTPTMGVGRAGNVFKLVYNPSWVNSIDIDVALEVLKHECLHLALNHFSLWEPSNEPDIHKIQNYALDMEVNGYLKADVLMRNIKPVLASDYGWENYLGGREYFKRLMNLSQQMQQQRAQNPTKPCNGGKGGEPTDKQDDSQNQPQDEQEQEQSQGGGNPQPQQGEQEQQPLEERSSVSKELLDRMESFDDHSMWPDCGTDDLKEQMTQVIEDMLVFAAEEVEKGHGQIPGELKGRIEEIRNKKRPKPVADWKRYFRRYLGNEFSEFIRKSKKRESRRFPDAAGNRHRRKSHILVAIDTSGSVSMPEYNEFFGQIKTLTATADFHVVECDACIQYEYDYRGKPNETLHGGGGTDFSPVTKYFNEHRKLYDALVYFTDGYCEIPRDTPKDTLWIISSKGDQSDRKRYQVNGASVAFIPKHE